MFNFIKTKLQKIHSSVTQSLSTVFSRETIDETALQELERILIAADTGVSTSRTLIAHLKKKLPTNVTGIECKTFLASYLIDVLQQQKLYAYDAPVHILVGINGSGKTTFAGKLAHRYAQHGEKVLLVAADTFRAAAPAQLQEWAQKSGADILIGKQGQDPASLIFESCERFKQGMYTKLIIDTAGRLQTKLNLMKELEKINGILHKQLPRHTPQTLLVLDAMLGQNSLEQAKIFNDSTPLHGIVLTKLDGTGKGGIIFAVNQTLNVPVAYLSYGEGIDDIQPFDASFYVNQLINS